VLVAASHASAQAQVRLPTTHVTAATVLYPEGEKASVSGLIVSRNGDDMRVRDENGAFTVVTLTNDTRISSPGGLFNMEGTRRDVTNLIPGLIVDVSGVGGTHNNLVADRVTFKSSALRVAQQIQAGTLELTHRVRADEDTVAAFKRRVADSLRSIRDSIDMLAERTRDSLAAINARFDNIDNYEARDSATVYFAPGHDMLSESDRRALDILAASASRTSNYLIEVVGFADATGNDAYNQALSQRRAQAVVEYLAVQKAIPLRRIMNPTGFGEADPAATNATWRGRMLNRRAEVVVLVNNYIK
jgi:outer membrane protein OmpA-like peptidoglycan-associated protein